MKKILFKPKPYTKAEQTYLNLLKNRPPQARFNDVFSMVQNANRNVTKSAD